ncbi:hypothetical protein CSA56_18820 [candidate division KSB3 bacterium]|uniref:Damage-control phosphatase ARMT1-like metal-binding domain-containing protein n=1 Tax=candidate division KSB3 bacterium TaxID=2044937 RepID=A0A2G6K6K8_9BACT|nr:MAG: hypothetical protein CSA56_18820 [candidate division KSB3 bacterium]
MKACLDCIPCQQRQMLKILRLSTDDHQIHEQVLRETVRHLGNIDWELDPMSLMKETYHLITQATGNADPYRELKVQGNDEVLQLYPKLQALIQASDDPLFTACKLAVAGNIMDFGAKDHFDIQETIDHVLETDFALNEYDRFTAALNSASSLLLMADNAGEIVLDKLLLETLLQRYSFENITVAVKDQPILNDATIQDVEYIGLTDIPNITFRRVNTTPDCQRTWMPSDVVSWIQEHDIVLSKGQANYEALSDYSGVYFLLIAKCPIVANDTGTHNGALIFTYTAEN